MKKTRGIKHVSYIPWMLERWDYKKNAEEGLFPDKVAYQANRYAFWRCKNGHSWKAKVNNVYNGRGCPECNKRLHTSFPEQAVFYYIKKEFPDAINGYRGIFSGTMELDIYIPSLKVGIEYDGCAWHKGINNQMRDARKYKICKQNGVILIRIEEIKPYSPFVSFDHKVEIVPNDVKWLNYAISLVCSKLNHPLLADVEKDRDEILKSYLSILEKKSIAHVHPELVSEWDYEKNDGITLDQIDAGSNMKFWWKCSKGHSWQAAPIVRARPAGCPYCSNVKVLPGFNDLETLYPEIAKEWDYEKNDSKPSNFTAKSGKQVWWIDKYGHSWKSVINNRTVNHRGCPYCAHEKPIVGVNDLVTLKPELVKEWDYDKNGDLKPENYMPASNIKVWWRCSKCGHEFEALISNRSKGTGCPDCAGHQIIHPGVNDLETLHPELAKEWDYEKNGGVKPSEVFPSSNKKYWWKDSFGHEWQAKPNMRVMGTGCPYCSGNKVLVGFNDLETTNPELAKEWNYEKNNGLTPKMITKGSGKKVWWRCSVCGNEYEAYVGNRVKGYGCKICAKRKRK